MLATIAMESGNDDGWVRIVVFVLVGIAIGLVHALAIRSKEIRERKRLAEEDSLPSFLKSGVLSTRASGQASPKTKDSPRQASG